MSTYTPNATIACVLADMLNSRITLHPNGNIEGKFIKDFDLGFGLGFGLVHCVSTTFTGKVNGEFGYGFLVLSGIGKLGVVVLFEDHKKAATLWLYNTDKVRGMEDTLAFESTIDHKITSQGEPLVKFGRQSDQDKWVAITA